jgi:prophage tail gpP-like protein
MVLTLPPEFIERPVGASPPAAFIGPRLPPVMRDPTLRGTRINTGKEIATLEVRGLLYTDWTSVRVEQRTTELFPTFQFEVTEETPVPATWNVSRFVPGDIVRVYVGGVPAVFGYITERHVGYDAKQHGIRLIGCGDTIDLESCVPLNKLDGHDGQSFSALARDIMMHLGIALTTVGSVDEMPFKNIQILPGERIIDAIERYARMRNIVIGSNANGGLLAIGDNPAVSSGDLTEGVNILSANFVLRDDKVFKELRAIGQNVGGDNSYGDAQNKQVAIESGSSTRNRWMVVVADVADTMHGIQRRVQMEKTFTEGSFLEANITVQGWFKDQNRSNDIWKAGEYYTVTSPMMPQGSILGCEGCIYEQSEDGTKTTLKMVRPLKMRGIAGGGLAVQPTIEKLNADKVKAANEALAAQQAASDAQTKATNAPTAIVNPPP